MDNVGKFIDFIITQKCTYACEYCSQSKGEQKNKNNASCETLNSFLKFLDNLEKNYEITITGGEALLHPEFFNFVSKIKEKGFKINLITNLSFSVDIYKKVFDILDKSLNRFDISIHISQIGDINLFLDKLSEIIKLKNKCTDTVLLIPIYKINNKKVEIIDKITNFADSMNLSYDFQHIHFFEKYAKISSEDKKFISNKPLKSFANCCYAGCRSAVIYENGEVYRCYSSRFLKTNHLGNINDKNFSLLKTFKPCVHNFCTCPKPKNYNQITDIKAPVSAYFMKMLNMIFLPCYVIKNKDIIKTKLIQLKNQ